jgi:hypothetical protein
VGDVPTLVVEDVPTLPVVEDVPILPVVHNDLPTIPAIEAPISHRDLGLFPSTPSHIPTMPLPGHILPTSPLQRKRKRAESGALERAVCKASMMKRRKRDGESVEKENVKMRKRVCPRSFSLVLLCGRELIFVNRGWLDVKWMKCDNVLCIWRSTNCVPAVEGPQLLSNSPSRTPGLDLVSSRIKPRS